MGETGSRGSEGVVYADGVTTQVKIERVQAHVHLAGETSYYMGSHRMVDEDEQFTWTRRTMKKVNVHFSAHEVSVTSNTITVAPISSSHHPTVRAADLREARSTTSDSS